MGYLKQRDFTSRPVVEVPQRACDCHAHIFGTPDVHPFIAERDYTPPPAPVSQYLAMLETLGFQRAVIVQPSVYGHDNRCTLEAVAEIGQHRARAVVAAQPAMSSSELRTLRDQGARGVRLMSVERFAREDLEGLGRMLAALDMHVQLHLRPEAWRDLLPALERAGVTVVLDHLALITADERSGAGNVDALLAAIDRGRTWVKLCQYRGSLAGPPYDDTSPLACRLARHAPERCVWGTDWPHPNMRGHMPDDGKLLDLMAAWAPEQHVRQRILVDNPAALYGFD